MKAVLISIQPQWVKKILNGEKTIEIRKTAPKLRPPFKCYIYCTKGGEVLSYEQYCGYDMTDFREDFVANGRIVAEFICNRIEDFTTNYYTMNRPQTLRIARAACLKLHELDEYEGNAICLYGWHISDLKIYDKPKKLCEFTKYGEVDNRPCENGGKCQFDCYDYGEDCRACSIDFSGDACPFIKMQRPPQSWCYVEELQDGN